MSIEPPRIELPDPPPPLGWWASFVEELKNKHVRTVLAYIAGFITATLAYAIFI